MPLPISVTYTFSTATSAIPLSQLDANFTTVVNGINGIGNGTNSLSNVSITGGTITGVSVTATGVANGTSNVSIASANGNITTYTANTLAMTVDTNQNASLVGTLAMGSSFLRNRIINGAMVIDQRNAGAAVTVNTGNVTYTVDRWFAQATASSGVFTVQQSSVAPTGFTKSLLATVTTIDASLAATDLYLLSQNIEGFNTADLGWGASGALSVTLSFWVRSSLTGTFGGAIVNSAANRSYPFSYSISAANTWEQKSITIAGDTSGTWLTDNGIGIRVYYGLGVGSTFSGTSGAWSGSYLISSTGATNFMATNGATFYITGVQLEVGSVATPFERRQYGTELMLCQRYYQFIGGGNNVFQIRGYNTTGANISQTLLWPVQFRASPTITIGTLTYSNGSGLGFAGDTKSATMYFTVTSSGDAYVSANGTNQITFSAEL